MSIERHTDRRTPQPSTGGASTLRRDAGRRRSRHLDRTAVQPSIEALDNRRTIEEQLNIADTAERSPKLWGRLGGRSWRHPRVHGTYMTRPGMYARDDADMERIELARIIHQERERSLEVALRQRRLLQGDDAIAALPTRSTTTRSTPGTSAASGMPGTGASRSSQGAQPSVSGRRTSSLLR
jgi:hypothetical protein